MSGKAILKPWHEHTGSLLPIVMPVKKSPKRNPSLPDAASRATQVDRMHVSGNARNRRFPPGHLGGRALSVQLRLALKLSNPACLSVGVNP